MELTVDDLSKWSPNLHGLFFYFFFVVIQCGYSFFFCIGFLRHVLQPNPSERATIPRLLEVNGNEKMKGNKMKRLTFFFFSFLSLYSILF